MRIRPPMVAGAVAGIAAAATILAFYHPAPRTEARTMVPESGGAIRSVVMQYVAGADFVMPVYRAFLSQEPASVTAYVACPAEKDFAELQAALGPVAPKLVPVYTHHVMTPWSRDRWCGLEPGHAGGMTLLAPAAEKDAEIWPERAGDGRVADDLAAAIPGLSARRSRLLFDGGDFLADGRYVFATRAVIERNVQHTVIDAPALEQAVASTFTQTPVLLENSPDHHAGMFMMAVGGGRMVVGDPSLARDLFDPKGAEAAALEGGADFSPATQERFDSVARAAARCGYVVTRMPVVTPVVGKNYLTFVNVIMDEGASGGWAVYMPAFPGEAKLTAAAAEVWRGLGFEVRAVDCSGVWTKGGTVHCLINVLERG